MKRSDYDIWEYGDLIVIIDRDIGGMPVTNDIENVVDDLRQRFNLRDKELVYRDSDGLYDWITLDWRQRFGSFFFEKRMVVDLYDIIQVYEARRS